MHSKRSAFSLTLLLLISGCASPTAAVADLAGRDIDIAGVTRHYLIQLPHSTTQTSRPLILLLHGHGGSASQLLGQNNRPAPFKPWLRIAEDNSAVLIAADGSAGPDGKQGWNDLRGVQTNPKTNDQAFLGALIQHAVTNHGVDANRVYIIGISNGGHMAFRMALQAPEQVAGIGVVVAAMPANYQGPVPDTPMNVAIMNGTRDRLMPYDGGPMIRDRGEVLSTKASFAYWADVNGCKGRAEIHRYEDVSRKDRSRVIRTQHSNCKDGTRVAKFEVRGGGHSTPSLSERYRPGYLLLTGRQNWDIEAAEEIWSVLNRSTVQ